MADKIQFRRDTAARWASVNPILLSGEIGLVTDSVNKYKLGDGVHTWNELPLQGFNGTLVDIPGTDTDSAMSQKGATDLVSEYNVSANNNNAEYTFAQAVALVPVSLQKGGLTIKYIDNTTHEYAIKRLMSSTWNTTESNWQGIDDEPTKYSNNFVNSELILITPFGTKYAVQLDDSGNFIKVPVVPIKAAFCGNSLFSRIASETGRGWTYYIDYALRDMGMATSHYFQNGGLETCTTNAAVDSAVDTMVSGLNGDETLVIVQLGDNALTVERQTVWAYAVKKCLSEIRQKCPNARVYWMAAWYSTIELMDKIKAGVKVTGSYLCDITGMIGGVNSNHIGGTYQPFYNGDGQSHVSTLENVTNVTESTTNNITVTFTLDGTSYTSDEFSVDSWSLSGTTLTYESLSQIITSQGIASHPSDLGFRKIANKFLKDAGVTDTDYYNVG